MKRVLAIFLCLTAFLLPGCKKQPFLTVSPESLSFSESGGSKTVSISANYPWTASTSGTGFSVSPSSGEGSGSVTVTAAAASSADMANGTLTVRSEGLSASVKLTQDPKTTVLVGNAAEVPAEGGIVSVDIQYNTDYNVEVESSAKSWITFNGTKALSTGKLEFTIAANTGADARSGKVTIKDKSGKADPVTLTITQKAYVPVTGVSLDVTSAELEIGESISLQATVKPDDATDKTVKWSSDKPAVATVDENGKVDAVATGTAKITATAGNKSATCTVKVCKSAYATERAALEAIYKANDGSSWRYKKNWCTDEPLKDWENVTMTSDGKHVQKLVLREVDGYIPKEIADLTELEELTILNDFYLASKASPLPSAIGKLSKLKHLELQYYSLSGTLPSSLYDLQDLEFLCINYAEDMKASSLPSDIGKLTKLNTLRLNGMNLKGALPREIGNLSALTTLTMFENKLTGSLPETFGGLINLEWVDFSVNELSGDIPSTFFRVKNYWRLWPDIIWGNQFTQDNLRNSKIPAPKSPPVTTLSGKELNLEDVFSKNQYTVLFSTGPDGNGGEILPDLVSLYAQKHADGLEIITYYDNPEYGNNADKKVEEFKEYLKECGVKWESFVRYMYKDYGENAPFYAATGETMYPFGSTDEIVIVGPDGTVCYSTMVDSQDMDRMDLQNALSYIRKVFNAPAEYYESKSYDDDGKVTTLQKASVGNGIDIVVTGDGFSDRMISKGTFKKVASQVVEDFFSVEPYKSMRKRFNVYLVNAVSKNEEYFPGSSTALSGYFSEARGVGCDLDKALQYASKAVGSSRMDEVLVMVLVNSKRSGGTCYWMDAENQNTYAGGANVAVFAYKDVSVSNGISRLAGLVVHEAAGHGFGKLADEYSVRDYGKITSAAIESLENDHQLGYYMNVDSTSDPAKVLWSKYIGDSRFSGEKIGIYQGGYTFWSGIWRPTEQSVMNANDIYLQFNAPSRAQIYTRIMKLSEGSSWNFDYETFVKWDQSHPTILYPGTKAATSFSAAGEELGHVPPVRVNKTWREVMYGK